MGIPADTAQDVRHRAAALSTTPAEDQRQPVLFPVAESVTQMVGDVFGDVGRADLLGGKRRNLLVQGADLDPLLVAEYRAVDRSGQMVFGKLSGCAHIDERIESADFFNGGDTVFHDFWMSER